MIETFKIANGKYRINSESFFKYDEGGRRGHSKKLFKKRTRLDVKKYSFSNRVVDKWNSLTDACVNCITVNNFKNHILKELEPETFEFESRRYRRKPVLTNAINVI